MWNPDSDEMFTTTVTRLDFFFSRIIFWQNEHSLLKIGPALWMSPLFSLLAHGSRNFFWINLNTLPTLLARVFPILCALRVTLSYNLASDRKFKFFFRSESLALRKDTQKISIMEAHAISPDVVDVIPAQVIKVSSSRNVLTVQTPYITLLLKFIMLLPKLNLYSSRERRNNIHDQDVTLIMLRKG